MSRRKGLGKYRVVYSGPGRKIDRHVGRFETLEEAKMTARLANHRLNAEEGIPRQAPFGFYYVVSPGDQRSGFPLSLDDLCDAEAEAREETCDYS